jgi:chaperonin GroES
MDYDREATPAGRDQEEDGFGATIEPIGDRILFRKDADRAKTKGGIILPDEAKIPTIAGRIVAVSTKVGSNTDYPLAMYDRVLVSGHRAIPVELDPKNELFVIPVEDVVAVFRREERVGRRVGRD